MSARRSNTTPSVQLFPFLAVLVCVMGALIFLLLVTTRRIRQQAIERAVAVELQQQYEAGLLTPPPDPEPVEPEPELEPPEFLAPPIVAPIAEPPPEPVPLPPTGPTAAELRAEWEQIVAALVADQQHFESQLKQAGAEAGDESARLEALASQLLELQRRKADLAKDLSRFRDASAQTTQDRTEAERELSRVAAELERLHAERAEATGKYSIVPYDGQSGTSRRPIVIECTGAGLAFAAEKIVLTPQQLNGFTPTYNPLLAGTEALITYWAARDLREMSSGHSPGRPYVLLVVRPGGTTGYYVARRLLEGLDQQFGYELVSDDQQFAWPETDSAAVAACRQAVDSMLAQRDRLIAQTRTGRVPVATQLQFADQDGRFYLEEVERLRRGQNTVNVGGRQFERAPSGPRQSPPRVVEIPRGGGASTGTASGGTTVSRPFAPAGTMRGAPDASNNAFESAVAARQVQNRSQGQSGTSGDSSTSGGPGLVGNAGEDGDSGSTGASTTDPDLNPSGGTAQAGELTTPGNTGTDGWANEKGAASATAPTQGGWGPPARNAQPAGRVGSNSGPRPMFGSSATAGGPDLPQSQVAVLHSSGRGATTRDTDIDNRQWGVREPGSSIGLEREVVVRIAADEVGVADERPIKITSGMAREELQEELAGRLDAHVRSWGRPPRSFFWLPTIRFQVLPGGNQYQERLSDLTDHWGLRSRIEQVLE